jgi:hypothetical protein
MSTSYCARFRISLLLITGVALATAARSATLDGHSYVNHGLVGVGRIPAATKDKFGETFGSFSAFAFEPGSWRRNPDGSYSGTLYTQPDRGYNVDSTTNYTPRFNKLTVSFKPAPDGAATQDQVALTIADSIKFVEADGTAFTSLDPTSSGTGVRAGFPALPQAHNGRLSLDAEGIVINPDGTLWVSDEYGPYVFKFAADGKLLSVIRPPEALIPKRNGADSFASNNPGVGQPVPAPGNPVTGRQNNQGLEGLSISPDGRTLFTLLQSAARQEGGTGGTSAIRFNTRLLAYDITAATPKLVAEYIVQLPVFQQGTENRVAAQSELLAINRTQFLVLARDGNGRGTANATSVYRSVVLYDVSGATNIAGTAYDEPGTPIAPNGVLAAGIVPAASVQLIDFNSATELAKFGLHNGPTEDVNNLSEKWEALALVPALDPDAPNDYFLFVGNDNDFMTTQGFQDGAAYAADIDNDCVILVYRLTLPGRLLNTSARAQVGTGENIHILGFVVSGPRPKPMLIRAIGPGLAGSGLSSPINDPFLQLFDGTGRVIATNDDWSDAANLVELNAAVASSGAVPFAAGSKDASLLINLSPGAYTAHTSSVNGQTGVALIEIFEVP